MTNPAPLDFNKVEALRKHMLLTTASMAELLGVSRMSYYSWLKGAKPRKANEYLIRAKLKKLLYVLTEHNWPTPEAIAMTQKERKQALADLVESLD